MNERRVRMQALHMNPQAATHRMAHAQLCRASPCLCIPNEVPSPQLLFHVWQAVHQLEQHQSSQLRLHVAAATSTVFDTGSVGCL